MASHKAAECRVRRLVPTYSKDNVLGAIRERKTNRVGARRRLVRVKGLVVSSLSYVRARRRHAVLARSIVVRQKSRLTVLREMFLRKALKAPPRPLPLD